MKNNPEVNIRTDYAIDDIVKPRHMNALTESVRYDYVVTEEMIQSAIEAGSTEIDVDALLGGEKIRAVAGEYHVLINGAIPSNAKLVFWYDNPEVPGQPTASMHVHIHANSKYTAKMACASGHESDRRTYFYFHTHGTDGAVTFESISPHIYVGSFKMNSALEAPAPLSTFTYEMALGALPTYPGVFHLTRATWMTNAVHGGSKMSNTAELYLYGTGDSGDPDWHVRDVRNYCVNHVAVIGHHEDDDNTKVCSIVVEAPPLGPGEEYDYSVVFEFEDSTGAPLASVENAEPEVHFKWKLDTAHNPPYVYADPDDTFVFTEIDFDLGLRHEIEVLGGRWSLHRF